MPFMIGKAPVRRTLKYLESCKIIFRENVKIFFVHYNEREKHHEGAENFVFWHLGSIQYKNPQVQCITLQNMTPSPFIKIYLDNHESILIDIDSRREEEIVLHLENFTAICKKSSELTDEKNLVDDYSKYTYFGNGCERHCMCEIFGQVPCPYIVLLPKKWRGMPDKNPKYSIPPHFMEPGLNDEEVD